jgi:hypothetical protein
MPMTERTRNKSFGKGKVAAWLQQHATYTGDDCLIFPFCRCRQKGYGFLGHNGARLYAHRFMCELVNGPAPADRPQAAHSCGNGHRGCVSPKHLSWKSNSENQKDRKRHQTDSARVLRRRLTAGEIAQVRALRGVMTQKEIAFKFGVAPGCIEYWHRRDQPPQRLGGSRTDLYMKAKRAKAALPPFT